MLALYRALTDAGLPLIRLALARRMRRGREDPARFLAMDPSDRGM